MRVLISAYACEPGRGSEPGAGWQWVRAAAEQNDVVVITHARNREAIERDRERRAGDGVTFVYVAIPRWLSWVRTGWRGPASHYLLWQVAAARAARRLHRYEPFDLVHHLTYANAWYPSLVCLVNAPFVFGPVGGGLSIPVRLYPVLGRRGAVHEAVRVLGRNASRVNPLVRIAWRRAGVIIVQNPDTRRALPARLHARTVVQSNAVCEPCPALATDERDSKAAVVAGRFVPLKGGVLAIDAIAQLDGWHLHVVGDGPDLTRMHARAHALGVADRVTFHGWLPRSRLAALLGRSAALLLPSLRDEAPFVAAEACAAGTPVVSFDQGGPAEFARRARSSFILVPFGNDAREGARNLAAALDRIARSPFRFAPDDAFALRHVSDFLRTTYTNVARCT